MGRFNIASDTFDFTYNKQNIKVLWNRQNYSLSDEYNANNDFVDRIELEYKGVTAYDFFKSKNIEWWNRATRLCMVIDVAGREGFETYKKYNEKVSSISRKYLIINNKIFKPQINEYKLDGLHTWHVMSIEMEDNTIIDGVDRSLFNQNERDLSRKTEYSYSKTFKNLIYKVVQYYKKNSVEPKADCIQEELTKEFQEISEWFANMNIELII